jgi:hypothetical protein
MAGAETTDGEEFRVEVDLDDEDHGFDLGERLRSVDLDDEARERLGSRVVVTRDGPRMFLYANTREGCQEAERVVRELLSADDLTADVRSTRWHPIAQEWKDLSAPMPDTEEAAQAEARERNERQAEEDPGIKRTEFVTLGSYKPKFLRDLGL